MIKMQNPLASPRLAYLNGNIFDAYLDGNVYVECSTEAALKFNQNKNSIIS